MGTGSARRFGARRGGAPQGLSKASELLGQPLMPGQPCLDRLQCAQRAANTSLNILSERENRLTTSLPEEPAPAPELVFARGHGPTTISAGSVHQQPRGTNHSRTARG